jgi:hypothetical protein
MTSSVNEGKAAWKELKQTGKKTWAMWVKVGKALEEGRAEIRKELGISESDERSHLGKGFNKRYGEWLKGNGFDDTDKSARSYLKDCMKNLDAIETFRAKFSDSELAFLNHPHPVWNAFPHRKSRAEEEAEKAGLKREMEERNKLPIGERGAPSEALMNYWCSHDIDKWRAARYGKPEPEGTKAERDKAQEESDKEYRKQREEQEVKESEPQARKLLKEYLVLLDKILETQPLLQDYLQYIRSPTTRELLRQRHESTIRALSRFNEQIDPCMVVEEENGNIIYLKSEVAAGSL